MKKMILGLTLLFITFFSSTIVNAEENIEPQKDNYFVEFDFPKITHDNKKDLKSKSDKLSKIIKKNAEVIKTYENFPFILISTDEKTIEKIKKLDEVISVSKEETFDLKPSTDGVSIQQSCSGCDNNYLMTTKAQALLNQGYTGKGTKIAVMDSGVYSDHQDINLAGEVTCIKDELNCFASFGNKPLDSHGTEVSGIINGKGNVTKGVAPGASLYSIKFGYLNTFYNWRAEESSFINGIDWAISSGIHIINMSFHLPGGSSGNTEGILSKAFTRTVVDYGILFIGAAGNDGVEGVGYPASSDYVLAISNYDYRTNLLNGSSSYGDEIDFTAPGVNLYLPTDSSSNSYSIGTGTSMSAPMVAGIAALLREKYSSTNSNITNLHLIDYMQFMAKKISAYGTYKNNKVGYGLIQGEIGNSISQKITVNDNLNLHNMPSSNYKLSLNVSPQTLNAIREYNGWYEVQTWVGYRWIKPSSYFINEFKITLHQETTNLYDSPNGNFTGANLSSQTVIATKRSGDWFQVRTWLGEKWIKPYYYSYSEY